MVMIFIYLLACSSTSTVQSIVVSGGNWEIIPSDTTSTSVQVEGFGGTYQIDGTVYATCLSECVGQIAWPYPKLDIDSSSAIVSIQSIDSVSVHAETSTILIENSVEVEVQALFGDIWIDAPQEATISVFSSYGDVDVHIPQGNWKWYSYGGRVISQISPTEPASPTIGEIQLYVLDGTVRITTKNVVSSLY